MSSFQRFQFHLEAFNCRNQFKSQLNALKAATAATTTTTTKQQQKTILNKINNNNNNRKIF